MSTYNVIFCNGIEIEEYSEPTLSAAYERAKGIIFAMLDVIEDNERFDDQADKIHAVDNLLENGKYSEAIELFHTIDDNYRIVIEANN